MERKSPQIVKAKPLSTNENLPTDNIKKTVIAFANNDRGKIFVGVDACMTAIFWGVPNLIL